jgi:hypothetical protein
VSGGFEYIINADVEFSEPGVVKNIGGYSPNGGYYTYTDTVTEL